MEGAVVDEINVIVVDRGRKYWYLRYTDPVSQGDTGGYQGKYHIIRQSRHPCDALWRQGRRRTIHGRAVVAVLDSRIPTGEATGKRD